MLLGLQLHIQMVLIFVSLYNSLFLRKEVYKRFVFMMVGEGGCACEGRKEEDRVRER